MSKWIHRLTNKDIEKKNATCCYCGNVKISKHGKTWRCNTSLYKWKRKNCYKGDYKKPTGKCEICGRIASKLDHNHKTGKFRGFLCTKCNLGLGCFEDSPNFLLSAIRYLKKPSNRRAF